MRDNNKSRTSVIKRQNKERTATDFVSDCVKRLSTDNKSPVQETPTILCLARSPSSPVAKALAALSGSLTQNGFAVRVIFSRINDNDEALSWIGDCGGVTFARDIRLLTKPELLEAHEFLVVGETDSWIGDSLRREPNTNDAYESYTSDCTRSARSATLSFEKFWEKCSSVITHTISMTACEDDQEITPGIADGKIPACPFSSLNEPSDDETDQDSQPMSATRH